MKTLALLISSILLLTMQRLAAADANAPSPSPSVKHYKDVGPDEFNTMRTNQNTVVIDVRTPKEFSAGHIPDATNIDWYADFDKKVSGLNKNKTYLVHCGAGARSSKAAERMTELQFTNVFNLKGGFKGWEKAGKPVVTP